MKIILLALAAFTLFAQSLGVTTGTKTVTTAGTAVRIIANNTPMKSGTIQALHSNTGRVCVGGSNVSVASNIGTCLSADQTAPLYAVPNMPFDLSNFYVDSGVNAEGVSYTIYVQQ